MADVKPIYINADGLPEETSPTADSIQLLSLKTANFELTDARLGNLVGGTDIGATEHNHDGIYFREAEHVNASAGVADAGKPVVLDAAGLLDSSLINFGAIDHGGLSGLLDDDHTQYILVDGTRAFTGDQSMGGFKLTGLADPTLGTDAVNLQTLQAQLQGLKPKEAVRVASTADVTIATAPASIDGISLSSGNRVLLKDQTAAAENGIYVFNGAGSAMTRAEDFDSLTPIDEINGAYTAVQEGTANEGKKYVQQGTVATLGTDPINFVFFNAADSITASTGLVKVGNDIQIDPSAAGDGLGFSAGVLSVNVDDATVEIATDILQVKADGINDTHIDFGTGVNQVNAADLPVIDSGNNFTGTDVEAVLAELATQAGVVYTADGSGVSAGDAVFVSANDTVSTFSTITDNERVVGLALTAAAPAASVKVLQNDTVITGILVGAVAGDTYYWNGTSLSTTIPPGGGSLVYKAGVAKNATDLHVEVELVKKNA